MIALFKTCPLPLLALVAGLALATSAHAQGKKGVPRPDKKAQQEAAKKAEEAARKAREAAEEEKVLKEAEALREALAYLLVANKDYDGHRVKAIKQVEDAVNVLDGEVKRKGTRQQKDVVAAEEKRMEELKKRARETKPVHEGQPLSDAQLGHAHKLLGNVQGVLAQAKQERPLKHVDNAIKQIEIALKVR